MRSIRLSSLYTSLIMLFLASCRFTSNPDQKPVNTDTIYATTTTQLKANHIPDSVFSLLHLKYLSVQGMDCDFGDRTSCWMLDEIPGEIKNLKKLISLRLNVNNIRNIPVELSELKDLKILDLTDNPGLTDIDNICNAINLEELYLYGCNLSKLPAGIDKLKNLKSLGLAGNNLSNEQRSQIRKALPDCNIIF